MLAPVAEMTLQQLWRELLIQLKLVRAAGTAAAAKSLRTELKVARTRKARHTEGARSMWMQASAELEADLEPLAHDMFEIRKGGKWTRVIRGRVMLNDPVSIEIAETKPLARRLLASSGLPVPDWAEFPSSQRDQAAHFLGTHTAPLVVKPAASSAGHGITTNIRSESQLRDAVAAAARFGSPLVIERQAAGDVYRVLVLDDEIVDVVRRRPPRLVGDGSSTVAQLIASENSRRLAEPSTVVSLPIDFDCLFTLQAQDLSLSSVPAVGTTFNARTVTNFNAPSENETIDAPIGDALRGEAVQAVRRLGLRLAGLDIVTPNVALGLVESGGVLLEVNPVPGLHHHYRVANRSQSPSVALKILRRLLEE
jgi:cyanophycin synthetase